MPSGRQRRRLSRLGALMRFRDIRACNIARQAGVSRRHVTALKYGDCEPTRPVMVWITLAARRIVGQRVSLNDLFDLDDVWP